MRSALAGLLLLGCSSSSSAPSAPVDAGSTDASAACVFNADCPESQRCECLSEVCACRDGARGTGQAGVDACTTGNDCESGLCVEAASGFVCSGPCDAGCGDKLPRCTDVATIGRICTREPASVGGAVGTFSGKTWSFDRAYFGFDLGDAGPTAPTLEIHAGSDGTCPPPKKDPQATIVVSGLPGALAATSYPDLKATLLGFDPALPLHSTATSVKVDLSSIAKCAAPDAALACSFDASVTLAFAEGNVVGTVHAIHCASLDAK
jgi:hypothetical protein